MQALKTVLVVDDDPVIGRSFDRVLGDRGYAVVTARNGADALDKIARASFDMVYTDIKMPGMDGLDLAARVKAVRPWLPVVIVTGYGTEASETKAAEIGVNAFLRKPLSPELIERSACDVLRPAQAPAAAPAATAPTVRALAAPPETGWALVRNIAMLIAGPFVGLAFVVLLPIAGLALLAGLGIHAVIENSSRLARFLRNVALFLAAPFVGLLYVTVLPFVGLGLLAWHGYSALMNRKRAE